MCLYSIYARKDEVRKARVGENLTVGEYQRHGCLKGDDGLITCIKPGTQLRINDLQFAGYTPVAAALSDFVGTSVTITLLKGAGRRFTADVFELDGHHIHIDYLARGVTASIPRKVRSDKGKTKPRNLEKVLGMDQIRAYIQHEPDADRNAELDEIAREYVRDELAKQS